MFIGVIDIGGTKTIVAICNEKGKVLEMEKFQTEENEWRKHFAITAEKFNECAHKLGINIQKDLKGVGINVPGMVDEEGILVYAPYQNWRNVPVRDFFSSYFEFEKIVVENDVNSCAIGEMMFANGGKDFIWIALSTGNRGAIVANGELIRGDRNCAGEFGHLKVAFESPRQCACGQYGCLEAYSSGSAIKEEFEELLRKDFDFSESLINKQFLDETLTVDAYGLSLLAREGNPLAINIFIHVGMYLGRAISYGLNILNSKTVYLGGGIAESLDLILPSIITEIEKCTVEGAACVEICKTKLGDTASILGAVGLVLQKYDLVNKEKI